MNSPSCSSADRRENRALGRFAAVQAVIQARRDGQTLTRALHQAAQQPWDGRQYCPATLEDWFYRWRQGQFAALHDRPRRDRGEHRALDPVALEALTKLRREYPQLTVKALAEELVRRGVLAPEGFSPSTLYRRLAEAGLDRASLRAGAEPLGAPTKAFELPLPNLLWMADCMHGPTLETGQGAARRAFLFALLDDCSRLCVHGQFYAQERLEGFLDTLRQAVQTRGLPDKLYTDNGAAFRSRHLGLVCANLGIRLLHCKPYHSWSKGKIERFFSTVQTRFLPKLVFEPARSLEALNQRFWQWLETDYHRGEHTALDGESPAGRFARLGQGLRLLGPDAAVDRLFLMRVARRVRKDATFSLGGRFWEVAPHLRGQIVTVHFDPVSWSRVEVTLGERPLGPAHPCNKQRNSRTAPSNDYESAPW
jgi:putative transposase